MGAEHCKTASPDDAAAVAHLAREACALAAVDHPDVVELVDWDPGTATLRTALAGRHTLADLETTDAATLAGRLHLLVRTLTELHDQGWSHGRVRPDHVIVGSAGHLTLCSFGRAEQRSPGHPALLADHHDLARLGHVLLDRARPAAGRAERRARAHLGAVLDAVSRAADLPGACDAWRQLDPGTDLPGAARLLGLAAVGTVGAIALWWAGGRIGPSAPPQVAATAITIVRWSAVAACGYLAVVAGASGLAVAARATDLATTMLRAAPVPVRRLLGGAIGAGVLSLLAPRAPTPAPTPPPSSSVPTPAETPTTTPTPTLTTTTPTPSLAPATTTPTATTAPTPTPSPAPATTTPTATTPTATIGPGDHLWAVAERTLTERSGRPPTEREVGRYWLRLVALNRSRLADPTNPDLVLVGQVVELPD